MVWTVIPLAAIVILYVVLTQPGKQPTNTVNPGPDFRYAGSQAGLTMPSPKGLPAQWRATSSSVKQSGSNGPVQVKVGYLTPDNQFAQLVESTSPLAQVVRKTISGASAQGIVIVNGTRWDRYRTGRGEIALAASLSKVAVVITGSAKLDELSSLAVSLR
jgi:uncharacterized protein DUF4245